MSPVTSSLQEKTTRSYDAVYLWRVSFLLLSSVSPLLESNPMRSLECLSRDVSQVNIPFKTARSCLHIIHRPQVPFDCIDMTPIDREKLALSMESSFANPTYRNFVEKDSR